MPSLAGSPLVLVTIFSFCVVPFIPPSPVEVCEKFLNVASMEKAKSLTTSNLWPALDSLARMDDPSADEKSEFEILGEEPAADGTDGHLVGYRVVTTTRGGTESVEGIFQLVDRGGNWKIDELYYTAMNGEAFPEPVRLSQSHRELAQAATSGKGVAASPPQRAGRDSSAKPSPATPAGTAVRQTGIRMVLASFLAHGVVKKIVLGGLTLLAMAAAGSRKR